MSDINNTPENLMSDGESRFYDADGFVEFMARRYFEDAGLVAFEPEEMKYLDDDLSKNPRPDLWKEIAARVEQLVIENAERFAEFPEAHKAYVNNYLRSSREKFGDLSQYLHSDKKQVAK